VVQRTSVDLQNFPVEERYRIFEALSHPARVKILKLVEEKGLGFSALKHELGFESSGQLQHHLQKLTGFIAIEQGSGYYILTDTGRLALGTYGSSERSGMALEAICSLPVRLDARTTVRVGSGGSALRLSLAGLLLALAVVSVELGQATFRVFGSSISVGFGVSGALVAGFFGVSFLIAGVQRYPGCEVMGIPNLFAGKAKYYCSCVMTPFNFPNGRLLEPLERQGRDGEKVSVLA
jgi:DNA-binding transcriptional ArsR family regulator